MTPTLREPQGRHEENRMATVGRIVHYHVRKLGLHGEDSIDIRPAIITHVWTESCVNLAVFKDATLDGVAPIEQRTSAMLGEQIGQWNWPTHDPSTGSGSR